MSLTLHTSLGDLKIELECEAVPVLTENFMKLAASGTYDGTLFHRNMAGFIVQGGDPTGTGKGGAAMHGGTLPDEIAELKHDQRGIVGMANSGPDKNGSQFFVTYAAAPSLDGVYSVIGRVVQGIETLDAMERVPTGAKHRPSVDIVLQSVTINANPFATSQR